MAHRISLPTRGGGRLKSGEGESASPMRQCLGSSLEKLHGFTGKQSRGWGEAGGQQKGLATTAVLEQRWRAVCSLSTANSGDLWLGRGSGCASANG
jgi:hypothetical protein